jgi:hypothetical protein
VGSGHRLAGSSSSNGQQQAAQWKPGLEAAAAAATWRSNDAGSNSTALVLCMMHCCVMPLRAAATSCCGTQHSRHAGCQAQQQDGWQLRHLQRTHFTVAAVSCCVPCITCCVAGKTTLLRLVAGLELPTGGKIYFDDLDATDLAVQDRQVRRNGALTSAAAAAAAAASMSSSGSG